MMIFRATPFRRVGFPFHPSGRLVLSTFILITLPQGLSTLFLLCVSGLPFLSFCGGGRTVFFEAPVLNPGSALLETGRPARSF
jgi:hypothetical protein